MTVGLVVLSTIVGVLFSLIALFLGASVPEALIVHSGSGMAILITLVLISAWSRATRQSAGDMGATAVVNGE